LLVRNTKVDLPLNPVDEVQQQLKSYLHLLKQVFPLQHCLNNIDFDIETTKYQHNQKHLATRREKMLGINTKSLVARKKSAPLNANS
jgi:hypothetical protein